MVHRKPSRFAAAGLAVSSLVLGLVLTRTHSSAAEEPADTTRAATQPAPQPAPQPATRPAGELKAYTQTIPGSLVTFDLVPVPAGDGVGALYFAKHEATWDEFYYWAMCQDVDEEPQKVNLRAKKLRPSPPYTDIDRGFGLKDRPAIGMSRRSAELYCKWLGERTGKAYRLPTRAEWQHAYQLAYGPLDKPPADDTLDAAAWFADNADGRTHAPGTKAPTPQGICDLLGNVAEWVTGTGDAPAVVGGGFRSYPREMSGAAQEQEDQSVWNENDPSQPKSMWWYIDADYVGFRVVCEP